MKQELVEKQIQLKTSIHKTGKRPKISGKANAIEKQMEKLKQERG